jgi:predicted RNase H-like HicB family nuclease
MTAVHYESYTEARTNLKHLLDAASDGRVATVRRETRQVAVVDAGRLRHALTHLVTAKAEVVAENDGWSAFFPGLPIAADGATFDEAIDDLICALREYADDWQDRLQAAPNHRENWGLVQLIALSDDEQLRQWLVGARR